MKTIYFSASVSGVINIPPDFLKDLVAVMKEEGYRVLSEHIVHGMSEENFRLLSKNSGKHIPQREGYEFDIRTIDMQWVDQADYFVAIVDGPSHGVGMEIERALLRPERGLDVVPILCLVQRENFSKVTAMIKGVKAPNFALSQYGDLADASQIVLNFLRTHQ